MSGGIYRIIAPSGNQYIGSTKDFHNRRLQHYSMLRRGAHDNTALQRAYNKYGDELCFEVVEICDELALINREQWWIDHIKDSGGRESLYNASMIAGRTVLSPEVMERIIEQSRTPEARAAHSVIMKALKGTPEARESQSIRSKVLNGTPEARAAISARMKAHLATPDGLEALRACARKSQPLKPQRTGQYKGVSFQTNRGNWRATIQRRQIGSFATAVEAAIAYDAAAIATWGIGNCYLNLPVAANDNDPLQETPAIRARSVP